MVFLWIHKKVVPRAMIYLCLLGTCSLQAFFLSVDYFPNIILFQKKNEKTDSVKNTDPIQALHFLMLHMGP